MWVQQNFTGPARLKQQDSTMQDVQKSVHQGRSDLSLYKGWVG